MFGFGKSSAVAEHEAEGEIERVYHEIGQTLRVTGVNLVFRKWAAQQGLLPVIWDAVRPNVETRAFEQGADELRAEAANAVDALGRLSAASEAALGQSQTYQVRSALELYHYINPKLLLLVAMVRRALDGKTSSGAETSKSMVERIERGVPTRMYAMEMEDAEPDDKRLQELFGDIQQTLSLESINSDYRTLALWLHYLDAVWIKLKPIVVRSEYDQAKASLRNLADNLAAGLPFSVSMERDRIEQADADFEQAVESAASFDRLLPGLILNVALCLQDWRTAEELARSPFPARLRAFHTLAEDK